MQLADLTALLEKEESGESISAVQVDLSTKPAVVPLDISKLVKKRKTDQGESFEKKIKPNDADRKDQFLIHQPPLSKLLENF